MPSLMHLMTITQDRGSLTVIEKDVPFQVKRIFYTYGVPVGTVRGGHMHKQSRIALVAVAGACVVSGFTALGEMWSHRLEEPALCLIVEPGEWHRMAFEMRGTVLVCFASEEYDPADYIYDPPVPEQVG
jgi:hypothetical protein